MSPQPAPSPWHPPTCFLLGGHARSGCFTGMDSHSRGPSGSGSFHSPSCHVVASYGVIHFFIFFQVFIEFAKYCFCFMFVCLFVCFLVTRYVGSWASLVSQTVKNPPAMRETQVAPWVGKIPWRRERLPTAVFLLGESHGQRSLAGYSPQGRTEWDATG